MTTPAIWINWPSGEKDISNLILSGSMIAPLSVITPAVPASPLGKRAKRLNSPSKEKLFTCCMACSAQEVIVATLSSTPPSRQSTARPVSAAGSAEAVGVGAIVGVGVVVAVGLGAIAGVGVVVAGRPRSRCRSPR